MERKKMLTNQKPKKEIEFENVTINLPKNIVDYYRAIAHFQDTTELALIKNDIIEKLEADFKGRQGPD
jgi:hypothetical protein